MILYYIGSSVYYSRAGLLFFLQWIRSVSEHTRFCARELDETIGFSRSTI